MINSNVIGKNMNFSILLLKLWSLNNWLMWMSGPISHLLKRWNWVWQPELDEHTFFGFHEKESKYTAIFSAHAIFCISIYRFIKCTAKSQFENDVRQFP